MNGWTDERVNGYTDKRTWQVDGWVLVIVCAMWMVKVRMSIFSFKRAIASHCEPFKAILSDAKRIGTIPHYNITFMNYGGFIREWAKGAYRDRHNAIRLFTTQWAFLRQDRLKQTDRVANRQTDRQANYGITVQRYIIEGVLVFKDASKRPRLMIFGPC